MYEIIHPLSYLIEKSHYFQCFAFGNNAAISIFEHISQYYRSFHFCRFPEAGLLNQRTHTFFNKYCYYSYTFLPTIYESIIVLSIFILLLLLSILLFYQSDG